VYGNEFGTLDWTGCIAGQGGVNGNFSADPRFCDLLGGDLRLRSTSPCLDAPGCGLVGTLGQGCVPRNWYVATDGSDVTGDGTPGNPYATIQNAINHAVHDDTVFVACGTYYQRGIEVKSGIVLTSTTGEPDCVTVDGQDVGHIMYCQYADSTTVIRGLTFTGGKGFNGGAVFLYQSPILITKCVFVDNHNTGSGGALECRPSSPTITDCTFAGNSSPGGAAIQIHAGSALTLQGTLIAFNSGSEAVRCYQGGGTVSLACCDVYGNSGGDWIGCLAGQDSLNGNLAEDPQLCDLGTGDLRLDFASPCVDADGCGQIGAFGPACGLGFLSLADVGNDQGRQLRLVWSRSTLDVPGSPTPITAYDVYRRQDGNRAATALLPSDLANEAGRFVPGWDYVGSAPAHGDSTYQMVAPTLCDSTATGGICWTVFFVRAATADPPVYFDSAPDSGYSVDNLAPATPTGLLLATTTLSWDECPDDDFDYFTVWGSATGDFDDAVVIAYTVVPTLDVATAPHEWYHVTATDFAGNQGADAAVANPAVGVRETRVTPTAYDLRAARPNPFATVTSIAFDVPVAGTATLEVYDVRGRLVRVLLRRAVEPGRHSLIWDGRDGVGKTVSAGLYLVRFRAGEYRATRKIVRLE